MLRVVKKEVCILTVLMLCFAIKFDSMHLRIQLFGRFALSAIVNMHLCVIVVSLRYVRLSDDVVC